MTFNFHNDLVFDFDHDFEGHMKVKNIFLQFNPHFQQLNWLTIEILFVMKIKVMAEVILYVKFFSLLKCNAIGALVQIN